jgi:hypothetical protein
MDMPELELFDLHPEWRPVLEAYQPRGGSPDDGWLVRVSIIDGVPTDQLSPIHGKLIALGFLKCELSSRMDGILYQITALGRQALLPVESRRMQPDWELALEDAAA